MFEVLLFVGCPFSEIQVELDIFTGVANPTWTITNTSSTYSTVMMVLSNAPSSTVPMLAGYRGFFVTTIFTHGTVVTMQFGKGGQSTTTLETVLLNSNDGVLSTDVMAIAMAGINMQVSCFSLPPFIT